jgi:Fe-S cluster biogenesis protein NfuA
VTGVLPKDKELTRLRGAVINRKRAASGAEHRRFFDRLGELIVDYVRTGDANFRISEVVDLDWEEYRQKLSFSPAHRKGFVQHLVDKRISPSLADAFVTMQVLDEAKDAEVLAAIRSGDGGEIAAIDIFDNERLYAGTLPERVDRVVEEIIAPVLANDGGRLDILHLDAVQGEITIRFVGSCANCPYSLLSMEQIVKPTLLAIPGIQRVTHRARPRDHELEAIGKRVTIAAE